MRFLPLFILPFLSVPLVQSPPATAQQVQSIFASRAQDGGVAQLKVYPGFGLNLFFQNQERIKKAWLDDPSQIVLDFDAKPPAATLIHLRNISTLNFPGLRRSADHSTLLSIMTDAGKLYQFKLRATEGTPQYTTLAIVGDNRGTPMVDINAYRRGSLSDVERGLQIAQIKKLIPPNSPLVGRVMNFTALVRNGSTLNEASGRAGVSMGLVSKLADMGQSSGQSVGQTPAFGTFPNLTPSTSPSSTTAPVQRHHRRQSVPQNFSPQPAISQN